MTHSVSFRSSPGSVVTREIGEKMGIGGGHDRASGGKLLTNDTKIAIKTVLDWMKKNKPSFS
jgi:nanoRNase/pAp phosphatase (c-di-AMP/oligoRNAs hydrolase)